MDVDLASPRPNIWIFALNAQLFDLTFIQADNDVNILITGAEP